MSRIVSVDGNKYTFYIDSEYGPGEITVEASNGDDAAKKAIMYHYNYEDGWSFKDFCDWFKVGPQDFAPTAMLMYDEMCVVMDEINYSWHDYSSD